MESVAHDLFISYAQSDTLWVQAFRDRLEEVLKTRRQLTDIDIWLDTEDLRGGGDLTSGISEAVRRSAILVTVLSEGYLSSDWCAEERKTFIEYCCGGDPTNGRIFLIRIEHIQQERYPDELSGYIGFDFFEEEPKTRVIRPAALFDKEKGIYFSQFYRLRNELVDALHAFEAPVTQSASHPTPPDTTLPSESGRPSSRSPAHVGTVFLADDFPVPAFQDARDKVELALKGQGVTVMPVRTYWNAPDGFDKEVDKQLRASDLFVQLLCAESRGLKHDAFPDGYAVWLLERALAVAEAPESGRQPLPILRWRSRDFALPEDDDAFWSSGDLRPCDLAEFIPMIDEELQKHLTRQAHKVGDKARQVMVCYADPDRGPADDVGEQIEILAGEDEAAHSVEVQILHPDAALPVVKALQPRAMVVVTDRAPVTKVTERLKLCRKAALANKRQPPSCFVIVPDPTRFFLPYMPPRFHLARRGDESALRNLIATVQDGRATA